MNVGDDVSEKSRKLHHELVVIRQFVEHCQWLHGRNGYADILEYLEGIKVKLDGVIQANVSPTHRPATLSFPENPTNPSYVLLDDDELIRKAWVTSAEFHKVSVAVFDTQENLIRASLPKDTPVYVDVQLADGLRGEVVTKTLADLGYSNLHLATGLMLEDISAFPWIRSCIGKSPPWF